MSLRRFACALFAASIAAALSACDWLGGGHVRWAPDSVTVALPVPAGVDPQAHWRSFLDDMAARTGLTVRPVFMRAEADQAAAFKRGEVQAGWFSSVAALDLVRHANGEVFATPVSITPDRTSVMLVVRASHPVSLEQLLRCGKRFSYGEGPARSATGVLVPTDEIFVQSGTTPELCFRAVRAGDLKANALAVASGALDAAITDGASLQKLETEQPALERQLLVAWASSGRLLRDEIVLRKDLDPSVKEKLRAFFLGYGRAPGAAGERQRKVLAALGYSEFRQDDDSRLVLPFLEMEAAMRLRAARNAGDLKAQRQAEAEHARVVRQEALAD